MLSFVDGLWYLNGGSGWLGSVIAVIILICAFWKKIRWFMIPLLIIVGYLFIKNCVANYRESHPPKSKYDDMSVEQLIAEMDAHEDSIRRLPTFAFVEKSLKEDYGLSVSPSSYSERVDTYGDSYNITGIACKPGESYVFSVNVTGFGENMEYSRLWFESKGKNIIMNMADGSEPDSRQVTAKEAMEYAAGKVN